MTQENLTGKEPKSEISGAQVIVDSLRRHNVNRVYIFPGGTFAPILAEIERTNIEIFCPRNEQGAGYAAIAEAKLTGEPAVFMVTSGPGVTNAVTPVADAYFDNIPMVILTGQVGTGDMRGDRPVRQRGFQEVDTIDLAKPITKAAFLVKNTADLPQVLEKAFFLAKEGRPGPVWIDLPIDVQRNCIPILEFRRFEPEVLPNLEIDRDKIREFARLIRTAERPVILAGGGIIISRAHEQLRQFADSQKIPVAMSLPGLGAYPTDSGLSLGLCGYAGSQYCNRTIYKSDLLIGIGTTFHVRQTGSIPEKTAPNAKIVRIDLDPNELEHSRVPLDLSICGDAKGVLSLANDYLTESSPNNRQKWLNQVEEWKGKYPLSWIRGRILKPQQVFEICNKILGDGEVIITTGVGQHQIWAARHLTFDFPKKTLLTSSGHGTMGYDLPVAIGAKVTRPDTKVVCFVGDGSLQMNIQELATVAERGLDIKIVVIDNQALNIVAQFQRQNWGSTPATSIRYNPDFARIAEAFGIRSFRLESEKNAESVLKKALNTKGATLVHCHVDPKEELLPMLLGGHTLEDMTFE